MARVNVEDCLKKIPYHDRFFLVKIVSLRSRELIGWKVPYIKSKNKGAVVALREISEGKIKIPAFNYKDIKE